MESQTDRPEHTMQIIEAILKKSEFSIRVCGNVALMQVKIIQAQHEKKRLSTTVQSADDLKRYSNRALVFITAKKKNMYSAAE